MRKGVDFAGIAVVFFCHDGNGNYLFNLRSENCRDEHGRWDVGGGGKKLHEHAEDALRRELAEEYCVEPIELEEIGFRSNQRVEPDGTKTDWVHLDYKILIDPEKVRNGEPQKAIRLEWFCLDKLPQNLHSCLPEAFEKYKDIL